MSKKRIDALKYFLNSDKQLPELSNIEFEKVQDLESMLNVNNPVMYLIRKSDLSTLLKYKDLIADCGKKNKAKQLTKHLFGKEMKIPALDGTYASTRQIDRSINTFLENASAAGEIKSFILSLGDQLFVELWEKAKASANKPVKNNRGKVLKQTLRIADLYPDEIICENPLIYELSALIDDVDVPERLVSSYLGSSVAAQLVRKMIMHAAKQDTSVLILGPSGTGKEKVAYHIHDESKRIQKTTGELVAANCGAIPHSLFEAELFGHVKGAFTDAKYAKDGLWKLADHGTLLLDEIGDLQLDDQVKILRAIEDEKKQIRPVGSKKLVKAEVRVIAATNRDLFTMVQNNQFREDLYYRLNTLIIRTPTLKDNPQDIPLIAQKIWEKITGKPYQHLSEQMLKTLQSLPWPGNVRQLKNTLKNLYAYFGDKPVMEPRYLKAIIDYENNASLNNAGLVENLKHIRSVEEVICSALASLKSIVDLEKGTDQSISFFSNSLKFHIHELNQLCKKPMFFTDESIFASAHNFNGKLIYLLNLLPVNFQKAYSYWKEDVFDAANSALFELKKAHTSLWESA